MTEQREFSLFRRCFSLIRAKQYQREMCSARNIARRSISTASVSGASDAKRLEAMSCYRGARVGTDLRLADLANVYGRPTLRIADEVGDETDAPNRCRLHLESPHS
jgi:hypothetical protein